MQTLLVKISFIYMTIRKHFLYRFALSLAWKQRLRKLSIVALEDTFVFCLSRQTLHHSDSEVL